MIGKNRGCYRPRKFKLSLPLPTPHFFLNFYCQSILEFDYQFINLPDGIHLKYTIYAWRVAQKER